MDSVQEKISKGGRNTQNVLVGNHEKRCWHHDKVMHLVHRRELVPEKEEVVEMESDIEGVGPV